MNGGWAPTETAAGVEFPADPSHAFRVFGDGASVTVRLSALDASAATEVDGELYFSPARGAKHGAYIQRATSAGAEDLLVLESAAGLSSVDYEVALEAGVAGVRLVDGVVEFLSTDGTPRIRMARPSIEDANGRVVVPTVSVRNCAVDTDPRAPWGRPIVATGLPGNAQASCVVHIDWINALLAYPALLDPSWMATSTPVVVGRKNHGAALLPDGRVLVAGGTNPSLAIDHAELFDPATRTWAGTAAMPGKSAYQTLHTLPNGKVANVGGIDGTASPISQLFIYTPSTGTWVNGPTMPNARSRHTTTPLANGNFLVVGGYTTATAVTPRTDVYNPTSNVWTLGPSLSTARGRHSAQRLKDDRVLVAGGWNGTAYTGTTEIYDPAVNAWGTTGSLAAARADFSLNVISGGLVLAAGGVGASAALSSTEIYSADTGWFTPSAPSLPVARTGHAAVMRGPDVLLMGGSNGSTAIGTVHRYNPHDNAWFTEASLPAPRQGQSATVLASGVVLSVGSGGAETFGQTMPLADFATGAELAVEWQSFVGTKTPVDPLTIRVGNSSSMSRTYVLRVVAYGLDGRESTRTLAGPFSVAAKTVATVPFPVNQLPVQSVASASYAEARIEYTAGSVTHFSTSQPIHYEFASSYASATFFGNKPKLAPNMALDMLFGTVNGQYAIDRTVFTNQIGNVVWPLATIAGKVYNPTSNDYSDVTTLPSVGGAGGRIRGSIPLDGTTSSIFYRMRQSYAQFIPVPGVDGQYNYSLCTGWRGTFQDAGYGEDLLKQKPTSRTGAAYAMYTVLALDAAGNTNVAYKGQLSSIGCVTLALNRNEYYGFMLSPVLDMGGGQRLDVLYRDKSTFTSLPQRAGVISFGPVAMAATFVDEMLALTTVFQPLAVGGGLIDVTAPFEDDATRTAAVETFAAVSTDSGLQAAVYQTYADQQCPNGTASSGTPSYASACAIGRSLYLGPFYWEAVATPFPPGVATVATHNSRWKFVVAHEFGHVVQSELTGTPSNALYQGDGEPVGTPAVCGCMFINTVEDRPHCLGSRENHRNAQTEGFGHFYSSKLMNNLDMSPGDGSASTFVYYKPSYDLGGALSYPPTGRAAAAPPKWLETKCTTIASQGVEWDWLHFFTNIHSGTDAATMANIGQIYRQACSGSPSGATCSAQLNLPFSVLASAATALSTGTTPLLTTAQASKISSAGTLTGINH